MKAGITIVTYRRSVAFLSLVLSRLFQYSGEIEVVVVSNSENAEAEALERSLQDRFPFTFLTNKSLMVLSARNQGTKHLLGSCQYFVEMDDDFLVTPGWLTRILTVMESDPSIGIAVPLLPFTPAVWYRGQVVALPKHVSDAIILMVECEHFQTAALDMFWEATFAHKNSSHKVISIPEVSVLVKSKKAVEAGLFWCEQLDGSILVANAELARRTREAGFKVVAVKNSFIFHLGTGTHITFQNEHPEIISPLIQISRRYLTEKYGSIDDVHDEQDKKECWVASNGVENFEKHSRENLEE